MSPATRKRINALEAELSELRGTIGALMSEMQRLGVTLPAAASRRARTGTTGKARSPAAGLEASIARGEAAKLQWVRTGEVVPARELADRWGLTPQALGPASARGEIFAVVIKRQRFYPREFLELDRDTVSKVTQALGELSPAQKLVFWKRNHGALGGKTVLDAIVRSPSADGVTRIVSLAREWAAEAGEGGGGTGVSAAA